jgi:uncharacterized membrane protein YphA (DoxX/SURF4 family)
MFIAAVVFSVLLSVVLSGSAFAKLNKDPKVVESIVGTVGVPEGRLWMLAALELAGAAGLLIGLFWAPLGIAAAIGVVLYFVGAVIGHARVGDTAPAVIGVPAGILVVALVTLVLRATTA